jgi:hypothetical protein
MKNCSEDDEEERHLFNIGAVVPACPLAHTWKKWENAVRQISVGNPDFQPKTSSIKISCTQQWIHGERVDKTHDTKITHFKNGKYLVQVQGSSLSVYFSFLSEKIKKKSPKK